MPKMEHGSPSSMQSICLSIAQEHQILDFFSFEECFRPCLAKARDHPVSVLRDHSWWELGDHMQSWGIKPRLDTCKANAFPALLSSV